MTSDFPDGVDVRIDSFVDVSEILVKYSLDLLLTHNDIDAIIWNIITNIFLRDDKTPFSSPYSFAALLSNSFTHLHFRDSSDSPI